ncbi:MAG: tRNA pseudouridine(55) synthase TruB [Gammaproteobacteria bacterium]|nr:tRNA pseudouridine(55) synthase TruB [Gammaproteobacteria bacterium]
MQHSLPRFSIHGILLLDKPLTYSSNAALQRIKRLFAAKKAGHTGSLDPLATGMLPICFGEATKFSQFLLDSNKTYLVEAGLGIQTSTGDSEGEVIAQAPTSHLTQAKLEACLSTFIGSIEQMPPMFSAIKHQGKPLYTYARKGVEIERKTRRIQIYSLTLDAFTQERFHFTVHCSKGTYVRTLVEDICKAAGTVGSVLNLRRLAVTPYENKPMVTMETLESVCEKDGYEKLRHYLLPLESAVQGYPALKINAATAFYLRQGQAVRANVPYPAPLIRLYTDHDDFIGVGEILADGRIKPHRLVAGK